MNKQINQNQKEIINRFSEFQDWFETYEYLIKIGKTFEGMNESLKTEKNTLSGCQSNVWILAEQKNNNMYYQADSDSLLIRGMIALLFQVVNQQSAEDIAESDLYFIKEIGLDTHLSPSRGNGLNALVKQIKSTAKNAISDP